MQFIPYKYQKYCIDRVISDKNLGLFLDMGLGKTIITLTAINELKYYRFQVNKVLVIAPKKVAESTWARETEKWEHLSLLRISKVLGTQKQRIRALNTPADIYVTNRENVVWLVDYYKNDWPFDMVVIDEFSSFKDSKTKRFKALKNIRNHIDRFIGLTGTPIPNGLIDLWAQVYLLDQGERLETRLEHYRTKYFEPDQRNRVQVFNYKPKEGSEETIQSKISDICISMKSEDYIELPDITYNTVSVELDTKAQKSYTELEKQMVLELLETGETIDVTSAAALTSKLLQLSNGAVYDEFRKIHDVHNCKIEAFMELVEQLNGKPALVFYSFQHDLDRLKRALSKTKLKVRQLKTDQDIEDWNNKKIDILLTHPMSAAYGLNLQQGGNQVVWFGLTWSLEQYQQANKRLHRQGQTEKVIIHHLVTAGTRDEDIMMALANKGDVQESLLDSLKARIDKYVS